MFTNCLRINHLYGAFRQLSFWFLIKFGVCYIYLSSFFGDFLDDFSTWISCIFDLEQLSNYIVPYVSNCSVFRNPLELDKYAEGEYQTQFNAYESTPLPPQEHPHQKQQVLSSDNIYMVNGLQTFISRFSRCGWFWMDSLDKIQLM